ncbi:MAG: DUF2780 domain-containing protein [Rhizobiales bacterium]|nr:hypothetical protein [Hyphomicrobiales bacterium]NRB13427.1 DUF2780 domain-containing protein [Hyphomicrobiales bacterium]
MDHIITKITEKVGIDKALATKAVGIILNLVDSSISDETKETLYTAVPAAKDLASQGSDVSGGGLMGMAGGLFGGGGGAMGAMAAMGKLNDAGLDTDQIGKIGKILLNHLGDEGGEELVGEIVNAIPGLDRFI